MLLVRRQRRPASTSCAGLQSRQLHADAGSARGCRALVADQPQGEARQDRGQDRHACPVCHLPDGRGRGAKGIVPGNLAADRRAATKTGSSVGTEGVGCVITTGGVCLNDEEKHQIGFSGMVRATTNARRRADGFRVPQQNASVHADPWSSGECRPNGLSKTVKLKKSGHQMAAEGMQHPWRLNLSTISANLELIWERLGNGDYN